MIINSAIICEYLEAGLTLRRITSAAPVRWLRLRDDHGTQNEIDPCQVHGGDVEDISAVSQSAEYLESLLEILACPLDNSIP